jgi:hypothetical protein
MNFVSYNMINTSTRKDFVNNITINIVDGLNGTPVGYARMTSFNDIWLELPETQGRYELKPRALKQLDRHMIDTLDDLLRMAWLVDNGAYILNNLKEITL